MCAWMPGPASDMEEEDKGDDNVFDKIKNGFSGLTGPDEALSELSRPGAPATWHEDN